MNANAEEAPAAAAPAAAVVDDDKPQPPPRLPWGDKPEPVKRGAPGASSTSLAATGADIAPANTAPTGKPVPEYGPKGWINKKRGWRGSNRTVVAPRPPEVGRLAAPAATKASDTFYHYATAYQYATAEGASANLSIHKPFLADGDLHTLGEIAVQSADGRQKIEVGWVVSRNINGDSDPHLFVYHWVDDKETCWNSCGWTQVSKDVVPGDTLPTGVTKKFGIQQFDGVWWVAYDSVWIGYFDNKLWDGNYTKSGLTQWFGEVASKQWQKPCTDMGNGIDPDDKDTGGTAARFNSMLLINGPKVAYTEESKSPPDPDDPDKKAQPPVYQTAFGTDRTIRFGGPGRC